MTNRYHLVTIVSVDRVVETTARYLELLESWRRSLGLTHYGFSQAMGGYRIEWSRIRRGKRPPSDQFAGRVERLATDPWLTTLREAYRDIQDARVGALPRPRAEKVA